MLSNRSFVSLPSAIADLTAHAGSVSCLQSRNRQPSARAKTSAKAATPAETGPKRYRIIVNNQDGVDASPFITVQVNGRTWQIKRDHEVTVPEEVLGVLRNAVYTKYEPSAIQGGLQEPKDVNRFPVTILGEAA